MTIEQPTGNQILRSTRQSPSPALQLQRSSSSSVEARLGRLEAKLDALLSARGDDTFRSNASSEAPPEATEDFQGKCCH